VLNLGCLFTMYCSDAGLGHIFLSLCGNWRSTRLSARMIVPNAQEQLRSADLMEAVPRLTKWLVYRQPAWPQRLTERRLVRALDSFDAVYSFPHISFTTLRDIQKRGKPVVVERINCFGGKARQILEPEYKMLGVAPQQPFETWEIEPERAQIEAADFHFAPSPEVETSLREIGISERKIIPTSYGWSPDRFPDAAASRRLREHPTVLFMGSLCVRKGVHLILRAWEKAQIRGRLVLCGRVEPAMARLVEEAQRRGDVEYRPYTSQADRLYQEADIFAFPSLEEGGPLVTYEAMAHGLTVIVSPMGAGAIVRNEIDGVILPPHDTDAWVDALRRFAGSGELRRRFGAAAQARAAEFTWDKVAKKRADTMLGRLGLHPESQND